jgi:hypothetical protein
LEGLHIDIVGPLALEGYNLVQDVQASCNLLSITLTPDAAAKLALTGNLTVAPPGQNIDGKPISVIIETFTSRLAQVKLSRFLITVLLIGAPHVKRGMIKIVFRLAPEDWHGHGSEGIWAELVANPEASLLFKVCNTPFFARRTSLDDMILAKPSADGSHLEYERTISESGNSTYMVLTPTKQPEAETWWKQLKSLGCSYESAVIDISLGQRTLLAINVPALTDIHAVHRLLSANEKIGTLTFQNGHIGHAPHKGNVS